MRTIRICPASFTQNELATGYAYVFSRQVTARPAYGGITLCTAIGAVVLGMPTTSQTPLSGHLCPVVAVVPIGCRMGHSPAFTCRMDGTLAPIDDTQLSADYSLALRRHALAC